MNTNLGESRRPRKTRIGERTRALAETIFIFNHGLHGWARIQQMIRLLARLRRDRRTRPRGYISLTTKKVLRKFSSAAFSKDELSRDAGGIAGRLCRLVR